MTSTADTYIHLRALEPEDLELMYRIENDTRFWQHGSTNVPYSRYVIREYLTNNHNDIYADGQVRLVIELCQQSGNIAVKPEKNIAIGFADLFNFDPKHQRAEIGLLILPEYQGKHYGKDVVEALCDYARQWHLHQIYAIIAVTNKPAMQLFAHAGFEASAQLHDWLCDDEGYVDAFVFQTILSTTSPTA